MNYGSGNPNNFPDIHAVSDGKMYKYGIRTRYTISEKNIFFDCFMNAINMHADKRVKMYGIHGLKIIRMDAQRPQNYQSIDDVYADDVLAEICSLLSHEQDVEVLKTSIDIFCEQMFDMLATNGTCPSGRANRMIQIYMFLSQR